MTTPAEDIQADRPPPARRSLRGVVLACCEVLMPLAAAAAIAALALEYGFYRPPVKLRILHTVQFGALAAFVLDRLVRLALARQRWAFLKENWIDYFLLALAGGVMLAARQFHPKVLSAAAMYVVITQVYILAVLILRVVGFQVRVAGSGIHPIWLLIGSFAVVILFGTGLLMLPKACPDPAGNPVAFSDALFTATSATCVTGLLVRDTATAYTRFGQIVILAMIQLGGLGIMIFGTVFALLAGRVLSVRESLLAGEVLSQRAIGRIGQMVKFVLLATFLIELLGALTLYPTWRRFDPGAPAATTAFRAVFHAVSAFCNAGFSLQDNSLIDLRGSWGIHVVMAPLIVLGGLGFPVLYDLARAGGVRLKALLGRDRPGPTPLMLHSKLVLSTSLGLLLAGAAGLLLIEWAADPGQTYGARLTDADNPRAASGGPALRQLPAGPKVRAAVFQSVTARTAGFNTVEMDALSDAGKFWMCLLMMVGGSPASTAGGMKTVTFALLVLAVWGVLRRRERTEGFRRTLAESFVRKATVLAGLYVALVVAVTLLLAVGMSGHRLAATGRHASFVQLLFEACSACGTVGLSCGVTGSLTAFGRTVIIAAMFIGRLGPLTVLLALTLGLRPARYAYPNEEVVLG